MSLPESHSISWKSELAEFQKWLSGRGVSDASSRVYAARLRALFESLWTHDLQEHPENAIVMYVTDLVAKSEVSSSSLQNSLTAIRQYCSFRNLTGLAISGVAQETAMPRFLSADQWSIVSKEAVTLSTRDEALVLFMLLAGLRPSECVALSITDVDLAAALLHVRSATNIRKVPMNDRIRTAAVSWFKKRIRRTSVSSQDPFFVNRFDEPLTESGVRYIITRFGNAIGIKLNPYILRNTFVASLLGETGDRKLVLELAGLKSTNRLNHFVHADFSAVSTILDSTNYTSLNQ
jgi:site-specific recombinase XerD